MLSHREKQRIARRISGKSKKHFDSDEWLDRKKDIGKRVEESNNKK